MLIEGGASTIQYRDKHAAPAVQLKTAARMQEMCAAANVAMIINDTPALANKIDALGVHVGQSDASIANARAILGPSRIVGASAGSIDEAVAAEQAGANYIGFGHIFPTGSKQKSTQPVGLTALAEACAAVSIPVIAIGGISMDNVQRILDSGAWGVAVIGAICSADEPVDATREFARLVNQM